MTRNFKVKATANGGATAYKEIEVRIVVCGTETLSLAESGRRLIEIHLIDNPITYQFPIAANFTSTDPDCPANSFAITMDEQGAAQTSDLLYKVVDGSSVSEPNLWLNPSALGENGFFI